MKAKRFLALASLTALSAGAVACKKDSAPQASKPAAAPSAATPSAAAPSADRLNLLPQEAALVGGINLDSFRATKLWSSIGEARDNDPKAKQEYEAFKTRTGWDALATLSGVHFAVAGDVDRSKEFGAVLTSTAPIDEQKVVAYLEAKAKEEKQSLERARHQDRTLYGMKDKDKGSELWFAFLDPKTIGLGGPTWVKKIVELSAGKGAGLAGNARMMGLVQRSNRQAALWAAGELPPEKGATPIGVTVKNVSASLDFPANGIKVDAITTTASADEAKKLVAATNEQVGKLKPMAAAMGLTGAVSSLKVQQAAADVTFGFGLTEAELGGIVNQVKGMAAMMMQPKPSGQAAAAGGAKAKHKGSRH